MTGSNIDRFFKLHIPYSQNGVVSEKAIILKIEYFGKKVWGVGNNQDQVCFRHPNYKNIMDSIIPFIPKGI